MTPLLNEEYTVGWICALDMELTAAMAMLDERHGRPTKQHPKDTNTYYLGRISEHNVVIACLPAGKHSTTSAATVASHMLSSFESIRFGLMVGIGGGIPSEKHDIRLGDVVVSKPSGHSGGVVRYESGKTVAGGQFTHSGSLNSPPTVLLTAITNLRAEHRIERSKIPHFVEEMLDKLEPEDQDVFKYQSASNDKLYQAEYDHEDENETCISCDKSKLIPRKDRKTTAPFIHYGVIGSGDQVMKHGRTRDQLKKQFDLICFEMEAGGLMDNFPCLVIRGISDYSDSHKNKRWQGYAAATAAAYTKELLGIIPSSQMKYTPMAAEVMKTS